MSKQVSRNHRARKKRFAAAIAEAMPPDVHPAVMEKWLAQPKALREALQVFRQPPNVVCESAVKVYSWSDYALGCAIYEKPLISVSGKDLGLEGCVAAAEMYTAAATQGLAPLSNEPLSFWQRYQGRLPAIAAGEPYVNSAGVVTMFRVVGLGKNHGPYEYFIHPNSQWETDHLWIFMSNAVSGVDRRDPVFDY